jgi:hypothetical protein
MIKNKVASISAQRCMLGDGIKLVGYLHFPRHEITLPLCIDVCMDIVCGHAAKAPSYKMVKDCVLSKVSCNISIA